MRLTRLLDTTTGASILLPLIMREMVYRLLIGEQGVRLRYLATLGEGFSPIERAVERLRQDFDQPLRIEDLARELGMSASGFHQHFKAVTALSPLQFQKQLRLQEARRLMVSENLDAASAVYRVGYQDASHFKREYKSLFGVPRCVTCSGYAKEYPPTLVDEKDKNALKDVYSFQVSLLRI